MSKKKKWSMCWWWRSHLCMGMIVLLNSQTMVQADSWTSPVATGVEAIHMTSLNTGRVFVFSFRDQGDGATQFPWATFNPNSLGSANVVNAPKNYFCAGHSVLENGDFIMTDGQADGTISRFNSVTEQMTNLGNLAENQGRWYPSTIILGNGKLFTIGGIANNGDGGNVLSAELYDPDTNARTDINNGSNLLPSQDPDAYPRLFLLSTTNANPNIFEVFQAGPDSQSQFYTINTDNNSASVSSGPTDPGAPGSGSQEGRLQGTYCRLYDGRVMAMGGFRFGLEDGSTSTVTIIDPEAGSPSWSTVASMQDSSDRSYFLSTVMSDGKVCVYGPDTSVEIYNPSSNSWSAGASASLQRGYHTGGVLLVDGRICVSGGSNPGGQGGFGETNQVQIYSPDYMTANRPSITSAPTSAGYGSNIVVNYTSTGGAITEVLLRRPGSSTHGFTYNMIGVPCSFSDGGSSLTVTIPSNPNLVPPGYYYLIISRGGASNRIPSEGSWIQISGSGPPPDTNPPSSPAIASVTSDSDTQLTATSTTSTDPEGSNPIEYDFDETTGNAGGSDSPWQLSQIHIDTGLNPVTQYCYRVRARDSQGNQTGWSSATCQTTQAAPDTNPPTPNPMTWASPPAAFGDAAIIMDATSADDPEGNIPVQYDFDETSGNPGGTDSGWQPLPRYLDAGLDPSTTYSYRVRARDSLGNAGSYSTTLSATTDAEDGYVDVIVGPGVVFDPQHIVINVGDTVEWEFAELDHNVWSGVSGGHTVLDGELPWEQGGTMIFSSTNDPLVINPAGTKFLVTFDQALLDASTGDLGPDAYNYHCHIHGTGLHDGTITVLGGADNDPPTPNPATFASAPNATSSTSIAMTATTASDASGPVEYNFDETTGGAGGTDSGWQTSTSYSDGGLSPLTQYCYTVQSRDSAGNTGTASGASCATTPDVPSDVLLLTGWVTGTSHADPAGSNRALVFTVHAEDDNTNMNASVTYGGQSMTKVVEQNVGTGYRAYAAAFILNEADIAAASNNTFSVSWAQTPSRTPGFASIFLGNVNQASLTGATSGNGNTSTATVSSAALSTNNGDLAIVAGTCGNTGSYTVNNGFTEGTEITVTSGDGVVGQKLATGANETPSITHSNANRQVVIGLVVNAGSGGGGDTSPPTPNPATFASAPSATSSTNISMTATTGSDASPPVEYFFTEQSGNPGGSNSSWQTSTSYNDGGLSPSTQYCYTVTMRDSLGNVGTASSSSCATTDALPDTTPPSPNPSTWASVPTSGGTSSISMTATTASDPSTPVEYQFDETSGNAGGTDSGWQTSSSYTDLGLSANTQYTYRQRTRDSAGNTGSYSTSLSATTDSGGGCDVLLSDDFEGGSFGSSNWNDGGTDCLFHNGANSPQGSFSINLQDNTAPPASTSFTDSFNASSYQDLQIDWTYQCISMDNSNEGFFLEVSTNGGSSWTTIGDEYNLNDEFTNNTIVSDSVTTSGISLTSNTQVRFRCDASGNADDVYLDQITISGCGTGGGGDTDPPTPNPATFASAPSADSDIAISMTATTASDASGPVEYNFNHTSGTPGGTDSGWQTSTSYTDSGLAASTQYCYTVQSRDSLGNTGSTSGASCATTQAGGGGGPITVVNHSFEQPGTGSEILGFSTIPGWDGTNNNESGVTTFDGASLGSWALSVSDSDEASQVTSHTIVASTYQVQVDAKADGGAQLTIELRYGTTVIGSQTYTLNGTFATKTLNVTVNGGDPAIGQTLNVRFTNSGSFDTWFVADNVRLSN